MKMECRSIPELPPRLFLRGIFEGELLMVNYNKQYLKILCCRGPQFAAINSKAKQMPLD